jgi:hypothetical protein
MQQRSCVWPEENELMWCCSVVVESLLWLEYRFRGFRGLSQRDGPWFTVLFSHLSQTIVESVQSGTYMINAAL